MKDYAHWRTLEGTRGNATRTRKESLEADFLGSFLSSHFSMAIKKPGASMVADDTNIGDSWPRTRYSIFTQNHSASCPDNSIATIGVASAPATVRTHGPPGQVSVAMVPSARRARRTASSP